MDKREAETLARVIQSEVPETVMVVVAPDSESTHCLDYHVEVEKAGVARFVVRSEVQWQERRSLVE